MNSQPMEAESRFATSTSFKNRDKAGLQYSFQIHEILKEEAADYSIFARITLFIDEDIFARRVILSRCTGRGKLSKQCQSIGEDSMLVGICKDRLYG